MTVLYAGPNRARVPVSLATARKHRFLRWAASLGVAFGLGLLASTLTLHLPGPVKSVLNFASAASFAVAAVGWVSHFSSQPALVVVGPTADQMSQEIELRNVHPAFIAAVQQYQSQESGSVAAPQPLASLERN